MRILKSVAPASFCAVPKSRLLVLVRFRTSWLLFIHCSTLWMSSCIFIMTSSGLEPVIYISSIIQIIVLLYGEKLFEVEGSPSQPSQLYRASVQQKKLPRLTELTAGRLSPEFARTLIFLQAFNKRLYHSGHVTQLRQFEPDSNFGSIFFLNYNARACSVNLHLAKLARVGEPKCIPAWQKDFPGRRVALVVPAKPSLCFA